MAGVADLGSAAGGLEGGVAGFALGAGSVSAAGGSSGGGSWPKARPAQQRMRPNEPANLAPDIERLSRFLIRRDGRAVAETRQYDTSATTAPGILDFFWRRPDWRATRRDESAVLAEGPCCRIESVGALVDAWRGELTDNEEFAIFEHADLLELSDERGNLYGMRIGPAPHREVRDVGTHRQQVAKFPFSRREAPWHGFPLGPMEKDYDPPRPPRRALPRDALTKMVASGLLNMAQLKRLVNGRNI